MDVYWILLAVLGFFYMMLKRRMRRQQRKLARYVSRFDEFAAENLRQRKRSDRETDAQSRSQTDEAEPPS